MAHSGNQWDPPQTPVNCNSTRFINDTSLPSINNPTTWASFAFKPKRDKKINHKHHQHPTGIVAVINNTQRKELQMDGKFL